jgi:serine/threonine protein kinase
MTIYVGKKFKIIEQIGAGTFGKIYKAENRFTNEIVAIKLEKKTNNITLKNEARAYTFLKNLHCIPKIKSFGVDGKYNFLVIDLLDKSLFDLIKEKQKLRLDQVVKIGENLIKIIQEIHEAGIIHRDIKPENFMFKNDELKIIDFGLSKKYIRNNKHIELESNKSIVGTPYFISTHIHAGLTPSRRDDVESIGYILVYLLFGTLPWLNLVSENKEVRNYKVYEIKKNDPFVIFKLAPKELKIFITYCRSLKFTEKPNYLYLINLLRMIIRTDYICSEK